MAGITGLGTTFNLPNYVGELFGLSREDTPFLSAIGGLTGGVPASATTFTWSTYDLRDASSRPRLEGADAPTAEERVRGTGRNVLQIFQEAVAISYTKLAAMAQFAATGSAHPNAGSLNGANAVGNEMDWQIAQALKQIARDANFAFLRGTFVEPATNATARQTGGLIEAITTNTIAAAGADLAAAGTDLIGDLMQEIWDNGGIREGETRTLLTNSIQKRRLTKHYVTDAGFKETSRNVGGVNVTSIETDFGNLNIMLDPTVPTDTVLVSSLEEMKPRILEVPNKGFLFIEPLAKTGAQDKAQIYGELGLEYGLEKHHGKITGLKTSAF